MKLTTTPHGKITVMNPRKYLSGFDIKLEAIYHDPERDI